MYLVILLTVEKGCINVRKKESFVLVIKGILKCINHLNIFFYNFPVEPKVHLLKNNLIMFHDMKINLQLKCINCK